MTEIPVNGTLYPQRFKMNMVAARNSVRRWALDQWMTASRSKFAVIALMLVTIGALLWFPVRRINHDPEVNYNEGWNAYKQAMVEKGLPLYGVRSDVFTGPTTYPPLSFHLISMVARHRDLVRTGRWVSLVSLFLTGLFIGLVVRELGADPVVAAFSTLLYIMGVAVFSPTRLGMNDPHLIAEALTTAGFYCYIRGPNSVRLLCASALLFCLAGFTKQNLVAFPAAVALELLFKSRKRFAIWFGAMILIAGLLTGLTMVVDGRYFLVHLLYPRWYSYMNGWQSNTNPYLMTFQGLLLVAIVWTLCMFRSRPLLAAAFLLSSALAFFLAGGYGVDTNIYFNALAATVIVCGAALADIDKWIAKSAPDAATRQRQEVWSSSGAGISAALMVALFVGVSIGVPGRLRRDHADGKLLSLRDAEFRAAVDLVKTRPGPALCESLLLCYRAGKPYTFDPFVTMNQIRMHRLDLDPILGLLRTHEFQTVQLNPYAGETGPGPAQIQRDRGRFKPEFTDELVQNYRLIMRTSQMLVLVPK